MKRILRFISFFVSTKKQQDQLHNHTPNHLHFRVNGAGKIQITDDYKYSCGGEEGFSFGVEWGKHGFTGGVLPKEEAKRLAEHILNTLKK